MRRPVGKLACFGVVLAASLAACITNDPPIVPLSPSRPPSNGLNDDEVHWYLAEGVHEFRGCMDGTPAAETNHATLQISITESGRISTADLVESNFQNPNVLPCLQDHIRRIRFPARAATTTSKIKLVFVGTDLAKG